MISTETKHILNQLLRTVELSKTRGKILDTKKFSSDGGAAAMQ